MYPRLSHAVALACAMGLAACATAIPEHVALNPAAHGAIQSTELVSAIRQSEIYVYVPPSQLARNGGGGLLLALIDAGVDSARTHSAETSVQSLRDSVVDYDFDGALRSDLQASLSKIDWLHVDHARGIKDVLPANLDQAITGSKDSAVMIVGADYHLSNDGAELTVSSGAEIFPNSAALAPFRPGKEYPQVKSHPNNALYRDHLIFTSRLPEASTKRDENMVKWSANHGELLRAALKQASADISHRLADDLSGGPATAAAAPTAPGS